MLLYEKLAEWWPLLEQTVLDRNEGAAAVAAFELQIDAERRCRHSQAGGLMRRGYAGVE